MLRLRVISGLVFIFAVSYWLGLREERRLAHVPVAAGAAPGPAATARDRDVHRGRRGRTPDDPGRRGAVSG